MRVSRHPLENYNALLTTVFLGLAKHKRRWGGWNKYALELLRTTID
jgi:hypothetical protein